MGTTRKWAMVAWDKLCLPKLVGGLGLTDLDLLNSVLEAKTWWWCLKGGTNLWARIWRNKYAPNIDEKN
jgi:hypothetical protein